jgi:3-oxoadipate enol-lactonase/4-carboxymuconolactone decarboxylase
MSTPPTPSQTVGPFYGYALPFTGGGEVAPAGHPDTITLHGPGPIARTAAARWFTPGFTVPGLLDDLRHTDAGAYAACCDALATYDVRDVLPSITAPTLVIAGRDDPATPPVHAREITDAVPGATLNELAHASHLAPAERPGAVLAALRAHFTVTGPSPCSPAVNGA